MTELGFHSIESCAMAVVSSMDLCPFLYHYLICIIPLVNWVSVGTIPT